ncbi:hypothetical protein C8R46DRAFT_1027796 [Mycena filopes]|nr:hypothetical protein C8R46DRAFT_1027796 [Mycena filopes]
MRRALSQINIGRSRILDIYDEVFSNIYGPQERGKQLQSLINFEPHFDPVTPWIERRTRRTTGVDEDVDGRSGERYEGVLRLLSLPCLSLRQARKLTLPELAARGVGRSGRLGSSTQCSGKTRGGKERNTATAEPGTQRPLRVREEETQSNQAGAKLPEPKGLARGRNGPEDPTLERRDSTRKSSHNQIQ